MRYAIFCYHDETAVNALSRQQEDDLLVNLGGVHQKLAAQGKLGPAARLMPTTAAVTLRRRDDPIVLDGPFAETKEALLGFYIVDCVSLDDAIETARQLEAPRKAAGLATALEIRPIRLFVGG
jgi:hypothetical protein